MLQRCLNPNSKAYSWYGARRITVCQDWLIFKNFFEDMGHPPDDLTLERKNNDLGYSPNNCKWATRAEQLANRRAPKRRKHRRADLSDIRAYAAALARAVSSGRTAA